MKKFSIIVPAHNAEDRLSECLDSVRQQSYKDYELIVICDKCSDATFDVARIYADITWETRYGNDGLARSKGLDLASGEYVMFLDDDDRWLHPYVLEGIAKRLEHDADIDVLCMSFIFGEKGYMSPMDNKGHLFPNVWSKCWRRDAIGSTRFPNVYSVSDYEFCKAMGEKNLRYAIWDYPIYFYNYLREGSISELAEKGKKAE